MQPAIYIMSNKPRGVLYIGVTSRLQQRVWQHKHVHNDGFTSKYKCSHLVYFECHETMAYAITREKQLKGWRRQWKIELIEQQNPGWLDLWNEIL